MAELERRARQAYLAGAKEGSQEAVGRRLTADEVERVIERFPAE